MIRIISQDKKNDINYANYSIWIDTSEDERCCIHAFPNFKSEYEYEILGEYPTEERAREVLEKLHSFASGRGMNAVVYFPMPEA